MFDKISIFLLLDLCWFEQLSAILGAKDVEKFKKKLVEYIHSNMEERRLKFTDLFVGPDPRDSERFYQLMGRVSAWPQDCYEYTLLVLMLAFIPHSQMEAGGQHVSSIQQVFSTILYKYLSDK